MTKWKQDRYNQFEEDMESAGFEVEDYHGRFYYHGPAVRCGNGNDDRPEVQDVIRATDVKVQQDQLGLGYIVYPA